MLTKRDSLEVDQDNPFALDRLGRQEAVSNLRTLISTIEQPFVLAVDGPWGSGKTTFVQMLRAELTRARILCFYFNAWESDFASEPLVAFIAELEEEINGGGALQGIDSDARAKWKKVREIALGSFRLAVPVAVKLATAGAAGADEVKVGQEIVEFALDRGERLVPLSSRDWLEGYSTEKKNITQFKEALQAFLDEATSDGEGKSTQVVFIIDELDRCRPDFAIRLLERIKHLFSVRGLVFLLALDRCELAHSIQAIYGSEFDANGYLGRFVDLNYALPQPPAEAYCSFLFAQFGLDEVLGKRRDGDSDKAVLIDVFAAMAEVYGLSIRTTEQCFTEFNIVVRVWPSTREFFSRLIGFLVALKVADRTLYRGYRDGAIGGLDVLESVLNKPNGKRLEACLDYGGLRAYLVCASKKAGEFKSELEKREASVIDESLGRSEREWSEREAVMLGALKKHRMMRVGTLDRNGLLDAVCGVIDLSKGFSSGGG